MTRFDKLIFTIVCLSSSAMVAAIFLIWVVKRHPGLEFGASLALAILLGLVLPMVTVAALRRLSRGLNAGWMFGTYLGICLALSIGFGVVTF